MKPNIEVLRPLLIAVPVECEVPTCLSQHELVVALGQFTGGDTIIHLCRKHYEDFAKSATTLP